MGEITYIGPERRRFHNLRRAIDDVAPYLKGMARLLGPDSLRGIDENMGRQLRSVEKAARSGGVLSTEAVVRGYSNLARRALPQEAAKRRLDTCPGVDAEALKALASRGIETVGEFLGADAKDLHVLGRPAFDDVSMAIARSFIQRR